MSHATQGRTGKLMIGAKVALAGGSHVEWVPLATVRPPVCGARLRRVPQSSSREHSRNRAVTETRHANRSYRWLSLGDLGSLVVDVDSGRITHFVLQTAKGLQQHELTLPLTAVDYVLADTARLKPDKNAVGMLPTIPVRRPVLDFWRLEDVELVVLMFDGRTQASEVLHFLQAVQRDDRQVLRIHEAAVLVLEQDGSVSVRETTDVSRERLRDGLGVDRSALIMLIEHEWSGPVANALGAIHGIIPQQQVIDTVVQDLLTARE